MKKLLLGLLLAIGLGVGSSTAQAVIVQFDLSGKAGNETTAIGTFDSVFIQSATLSRGSGLTSAIGANSYNSRGFSLGELDPDDYLEFTIVAQEGITLRPVSIETNRRRSNSGPLEQEWRSSTDGFTLTLASSTLPNDITAYSQTISLASLPDFVNGLGLREFLHHASSDSGTERINSAILQFIAVPEPNTYALIAGTGLLAFATARKVQKRREKPNPTA